MDFEWILTVVLSVAITICFAVLAMKQISSLRISLIAFGLAVAVFAWSIVLAIHLVVIGIVVTTTRLFTKDHHKRLATIVFWSTMVVLAACALPLLDVEYFAAIEVRRAYPLVSLANRLDYEATENAPVPRTGLTTATHQRVSRTIHWNRVTSLQRAHNLTHADFVQAIGFGRGRMPRLSKRAIDLPELPDIRYDFAPPMQSSFLANGSADEGNQQLTPLPSEYHLRQMHRDSFDNFLQPARMGYVKDLRHVAGFAPHRFTQMPGTEQPSVHEIYMKPTAEEILRPPRESWRQRWAIVNLELISLLRHPQPVAYVSEHLPQLDELSKYRVRDLTDFEDSALTQLQSGENCVIDDRPNQIMMVGSLRASGDCLQCHRVPQGTLLGALTYELRRD